MEITQIIPIIVLPQFIWVLWVVFHLKTHHKDSFEIAWISFQNSLQSHVAVADDFRKQFERDQKNIFNLTQRVRQLEDLVGKEDV